MKIIAATLERGLAEYCSLNTMKLDDADNPFQFAITI